MEKDKTKAAFEAKRGNHFVFDPEKLVIASDPDHPLYDPRGAEQPDPVMVAGIKAVGVIEPVGIIKDTRGRPLVVFGRRRVINARQANRELKAEGLPIKLVPALYRHDTEREAVANMIRENAHRKDEATSAKAEKARRAMTMGYDEDQVAEFFAVSVATLRNWLGVAALHPTVKLAVDDRRVRLNDAVRTIGKVAMEDQPAALAKIEAEKPTRKTRKASGQKLERQITPVSRLKRLEAFVDTAPTALPRDSLLLLGWLRGETTDQQLATSFPELGAMFGAGQADRRAP
jgi:ParB family chromosome partitioning protein